VGVTPDPELVADCSACRALCCIGPGFAVSADFAHTKPAGTPCHHLDGGRRCTIHAELIGRGYPGCVAYDCFGAGQRVVSALGDAPLADLLAALEVVGGLHELLWYLRDAARREVSAELGAAVRALRDDVARAAGRAAAGDRDADLAELRGRASRVLAGVSAQVRGAVRSDCADHSRAELAGIAWRGADLRAATFRGAVLVRADLRESDLCSADLLGADLRGADLRGADLTDALFLTRMQLQGART